MIIVHGEKLKEEKRDYIRERLKDLRDVLDLKNTITAVVSTQNINVRVNLSVNVGGSYITGDANNRDLEVALELASNMLEGRVRGYKEKRRTTEKNGDTIRRYEFESEYSEEIFGEYTESLEEEITKRKEFEVSVMAEEEAIEQMALLGHSFFLFVNEDGKASVLYKRNKGYGLITSK